jgi:hypothetical protein
VPFRSHLPVTDAIGKAFVGGQAEVSHGCTFSRVANLRISAETPDEYYSIN